MPLTRRLASKTGRPLSAERALGAGLHLRGVDVLTAQEDDLELISQASELQEWVNRVGHLPLR